MAEAMNRDARRAAAKQQGTVRVSNRVAVVPIEHVETYVEHEIFNEGKWARDRRLIILRPPEDAGQVSSSWWPMTLERMRETRRRKGTLPMQVDVGAAEPVAIDIGLIDLTVFFQVPPGLPSLPAARANYDRTLSENLRHFDSLCAGALHDQMIVATALHVFHSDGSPLLHYHNLIFGLRQEVRGDRDILGPLDLEPLLQALSKSGPLSIVGGMKPPLAAG